MLQQELLMNYSPTFLGQDTYDAAKMIESRKLMRNRIRTIIKNLNVNAKTSEIDSFQQAETLFKEFDTHVEDALKVLARQKKQAHFSHGEGEIVEILERELDSLLEEANIYLGMAREKFSMPVGLGH